MVNKAFLTTSLFLMLGTAIVSKAQNNPATKFTEGIVYSKTSFPGHPLNDSIKQLDFETGERFEQNHVINALKKQQQSITGMQEQDIKDAFFISGMMVLPMYSKIYFTPGRSIIKTDGLGYYQETLINSNDDAGKLVITDRYKTNQGTIKFTKKEFNEVWQKYQVNAEQYSIQKTNETAVIAGYPCKKIIYSFGGTSRGAGVSNYIINLTPLKVTAWYTDDLPSSINLMHTLDFELQKAILKYEVEYDKNKKNKMLVEVTRVEPKKIDDEKFALSDVAPVIEYVKDKTGAGMMIMQVMMNAIGLLTK